MTNRAGMYFEAGKTYFCPGKISFGPNGNGYHFAARLEDTLRYYPTISLQEALPSIKIAEVIGFGEIVEGSDEYNGYYDLYASSYLSVLHVLSREEILAYAASLRDIRLVRFLSTFQLEKEEIPIFQGKSLEADLAIDYYQRGEEDTYEKFYQGKKVYQIGRKG